MLESTQKEKHSGIWGWIPTRAFTTNHLHNFFCKHRRYLIVFQLSPELRYFAVPDYGTRLKAVRPDNESVFDAGLVDCRVWFVAMYKFLFKKKTSLELRSVGVCRSRPVRKSENRKTSEIRSRVSIAP